MAEGLGNIEQKRWVGASGEAKRHKAPKARRLSRRQQIRARRMLMEAMENRTMLSSVLPAAATTFQYNITGPTTASSSLNFAQPSIAYDPLDPQKLITVYTERHNTTNNHSLEDTNVHLKYSVNGGVT